MIIKVSLPQVRSFAQGRMSEHLETELRACFFLSGWQRPFAVWHELATPYSQHRPRKGPGRPQSVALAPNLPLKVSENNIRERVLASLWLVSGVRKRRE